MAELGTQARPSTCASPEPVLSFLRNLESGAAMHWRLCSGSIAIGGICLIAAMATGALVEPAHAQAQQVNGLLTSRAADESYPQWATPYLFSGLNAGSGNNQQAYTTKFGSGVVGIYSNVRDDGAGASGTFNNLFGRFDPPTSLRQDWFGTNLGNPAWRTSVFGSYKSEPGLFNGLYTTASFGVAGIRTNPAGFSGLTNFSGSNDVVGLTAGAGVGLQLTPNITVEGGFTFTQVPGSAFR